MDAHRVDSLAIFQMGQSPDAYEGVQSFLEKRPAKFPGKVSTSLPDVFEGWVEPSYERDE